MPRKEPQTDYCYIVELKGKLHVNKMALGRNTRSTLYDTQSTDKPNRIPLDLFFIYTKELVVGNEGGVSKWKEQQESQTLHSRRIE